MSGFSTAGPAVVRRKGAGSAAVERDQTGERTERRVDLVRAGELDLRRSGAGYLSCEMSIALAGALSDTGWL